MSGSGVCDEQGRCEDQQPLPQPAAQSTKNAAKETG